MNTSNSNSKSSASEQIQKTPQSAAAPTGLFRALLPADLIMCEGTYKGLSSHAVVAAAWFWIEARRQQRHWHMLLRGCKTQLPAAHFRFVSMSVNRLARYMGCGWRMADSAIHELIWFKYLSRIQRADRQLAEASGLPVPDYALSLTSDKLIKAGKFERVTVPQQGSIAKRHLALVLQRFKVITMKNSTLMEILGLKRRVLQRYLRELMDSGEIERETHAGYGYGRIRKIHSNVRPVRTRDRDIERPASSVQSAHASVQSAHASAQSAPPYKTLSDIHAKIDTPLKRGALPGSPASSGFRDAETATPRSPVTQGNGVAGRDTGRTARSNSSAEAHRRQRAMRLLTPLERQELAVGKRVLRGRRTRRSAEPGK